MRLTQIIATGYTKPDRNEPRDYPLEFRASRRSRRNQIILILVFILLFVVTLYLFLYVSVALIVVFPACIAGVWVQIRALRELGFRYVVYQDRFEIHNRRDFDVIPFDDAQLVWASRSDGSDDLLIITPGAVKEIDWDVDDPDAFVDALESSLPVLDHDTYQQAMAEGKLEKGQRFHNPSHYRWMYVFALTICCTGWTFASFDAELSWWMHAGSLGFCLVVVFGLVPYFQVVDLSLLWWRTTLDFDGALRGRWRTFYGYRLLELSAREKVARIIPSVWHADELLWLLESRMTYDDENSLSELPYVVKQSTTALVAMGVAGACALVWGAFDLYSAEHNTVYMILKFILGPGMLLAAFGNWGTYRFTHEAFEYNGLTRKDRYLVDDIDSIRLHSSVQYGMPSYRTVIQLNDGLTFSFFAFRNRHPLEIHSALRRLYPDVGRDAGTAQHAPSEFEGAEE